jgi:actin-like ATPase involved in cell morphogenesis
MSDLNPQSALATIDFKDLVGSRNRVEVKNQNPTSWKLILEKERTHRGSALVFPKQDYLFSIRIENTDFILDTGSITHSIKDQLNLGCSWQELIQVEIAYNADNTDFQMLPYHSSVSLSFESDKSNTNPNEHPYSIWLKTDCIQDFISSNQDINNLYLTFNLVIDKNIGRKITGMFSFMQAKSEPETIPFKVKLTLIPAQSNLVIHPIQNKANSESDPKRKILELGSGELANQPIKRIQFAEDYYGKLLITTLEYPDAIKFQLDDGSLSVELNVAALKPLEKKRYSLAIDLDLKKIPDFCAQKKLDYIITDTHTNREEKHSIEIGPLRVPEPNAEVRVEATVNFDTKVQPNAPEAKEWISIIDRRTQRNNFFAPGAKLLKAQIHLDNSGHSVMNLDPNELTQFLGIQINDSEPRAIIEETPMTNAELPYKILLDKSILGRYSWPDWVNLPVKVSYKFGEDIHPIIETFKVTLQLTKAEAKLELKDKLDIPVPIDLSEHFPNSVSLGHVILTNGASAAHAKKYEGKVSFRAKYPKLQAALSFAGQKNSKEVEVELEYGAHNSIKLEVRLDTSFLNFSEPRDLTFELVDNQKTNLLTQDLKFMPSTPPTAIEPKDLTQEVIHDFNKNGTYSKICTLPIDHIKEVGVESFYQFKLKPTVQHKDSIIKKTDQEFFQIRLNDQEVKLDKEYSFDELKKGPLSVYFNHQAIQDFVTKEEEESSLEFELNIVIAEDESAQTYSWPYEKISSKIRFVKLKAKPALKIIWETRDEVTKKLDSNMGAAVRVGLLELSNNTGNVVIQHAESYMLLWRCWVETAQGDKKEGVITLQNNLETQTELKKLESGAYEAEILPSEALRFPVLLNLDALGSLNEDIAYKLVVQHIDKLEMKLEEDFVVGQYHSDTGFCLKIEEAEIKNKEEFSVKSPFMWRENVYIALPLFRFSIENRATQKGKGQVLIEKVELTPKVTPENSLDLQDERTLNGILLISPEEGKARKFDNYQDLFHKVSINDGEKPKRFTVSLVQQGIKTLKEQSVFVSFFLKIIYKIQKDFKWEDSKSVECTVKVCLQKDLGPEWLAIDFGTSAIVAAFGDNKVSEEKDLLRINFQEHNEAVNTLGEDKYLLPSTMILFQEGKEMLGEKLDDCLIDLTPNPDKLAFLAETHGLPYIKSLIGAKSLLDGNESLKDKEYVIVTSEGEKKNKKVSVDNPQIMDIIKSTYWVLLQHFIKPIIEKKGENLNKIVLTIPNSYTNIHIRNLKSAIIDAIPGINAEYVEFISESDAIAFRYNAIRDTFERKKSLPQKEHVLVYDIGAGTIDLTYFSIEEFDTEKKVIHIIGRMSKNSAGNYFDYYIAHAMLEQLKIDSKTLGLNIKSDIKNYVKNTLKIKIANYDSNSDKSIELDQNIQNQLFDLEKEKVKIDIASISEQMDDLFEENTSMLFDKFFNLFCEDINEKSKINTVVITGRSSSFNKLQNKIEEYFLNANQDLFIIKHSKLNDPEYGYIAEKELKTIVALGALNFATYYRNSERSKSILKRNPVQAKYGLLYGNEIEPGKKWEFYELLSPKPSTTPPREDLIKVEGYTHFMFVQTYEKDPAEAYYDTKKRAKNTNYITAIMEFSIEQLRSEVTHIKPMVIFDAQEEIIFVVKDQNNNELLRQEDDTPLRTSTTNSDSFINSMWPYLQKKEEKGSS